jgi:dipeptidyl aminopeptidase/acylaminoacyl peptidase
VLTCLSRLPELWRAGVCECGPVDLISNIRTFAPTWSRRGPGWIGDPDDPADAARLTERSPRIHAAAIRAPLLLIHGSNDTRVEFAGTTWLLDRRTALGRTVRFLPLTGEGRLDRRRPHLTTSVPAGNVGPICLPQKRSLITQTWIPRRTPG